MHRPYSRQTAVYPLPWLEEKKFWPTISRIDDGEYHSASIVRSQTETVNYSLRRHESYCECCSVGQNTSTDTTTVRLPISRRTYHLDIPYLLDLRAFYSSRRLARPLMLCSTKHTQLRAFRSLVTTAITSTNSIILVYRQATYSKALANTLAPDQSPPPPHQIDEQKRAKSGLSQASVPPPAVPFPSEGKQP